MPGKAGGGLGGNRGSRRMSPAALTIMLFRCFDVGRRGCDPSELSCHAESELESERIRKPNLRGFLSDLAAHTDAAIDPRSHMRVLPSSSTLYFDCRRRIGTR